VESNTTPASTVDLEGWLMRARQGMAKLKKGRYAMPILRGPV